MNSIRGALKHLALAVPLGAAALLGLTPTAQAVPPVTNGLVVWLSADSINTADTNEVRIVGADTFVKLWKDGSGGAHNAIQTTEADQPKYIASGVGGKPVLRFAQVSDDAGSEMKLGDLSAYFPSAGSMFAVSTIDTDGRYNLFDNRNNDSRWVANTWNESQPGVFRNGRTSMPFTSWPQTGSHVFAMESSSSLYRFVIDGTALGGATGGNYHNGSGQNWTIGDRPGNGQQLKGDIPEIILYNRVLTTTESNMVGAYLTAKYGLTNTYPALPAPNVPTGVAAAPASSGAITVTWAAADGATSYNVSITDTVTTSEQVVSNVTSPYVASGLINGRAYDFKVSSTNSTATSVYSSSVTASPSMSSACDILTFAFPGQLDTVISGTNISLTVPTGTNVTALAPTYTVSANATGSPVSGTSRDFTTPQTYTVTAEDAVTTKTYTVTVTEGAVPNVFTWASAVAGNWSDSSKWTNNLATGSKPINVGQADYTLNFTQAGTYATTQNLSNGFLLNQLNFAGSVTIDGANGLALTSNGATLPTVNQNSGSGVTVNAPVSLANDLTVAGTGSGQVHLGGLISGTGSLTKSNSGSLVLYANTAANTYSGGTNVTSGTLQLGVFINGGSPDCINPAGTGPVTLSAGTTLQFERVQASNALIVNGASSFYTPNGWGVTWSGPITLNANLAANIPSNTNFSGGVSGAGGITKTGNSTLSLSGTLSYTGPTAINAGTLTLNTASNQTLPSDISGTGTLVKNGAGKLTLTGLVSHTGTTTLTAGTLAYNNAAAKTFASALTGAGGLEQAGPGTLTLAAANTYTGTTTVSGGTLNVTGSTSATSNVTVASGATLTGTGTIGGDVTLSSGALASFTLASPYTAKLTCAKALNLTNNVVHLNLADPLPDGAYTLATYASSTGALSLIPVIDSGVLANPGALMSVQAVGGSVILTVGNPPITISPATLPNGTTIAAYSQTLGASGGYGAPFSNFTVDSGTLPPGLTLSAGGVLSGTPTTLGTYTFAVQVKDSQGNAADAAKSYAVSILLPNTFTWVSPVSGNWSDATMWTNNEALVAAPAVNGQADYTLNFNEAGAYTTTQNLSDGFLVNQLNFGGAVTLAGTNGITLTNNGATLPTINENANYNSGYPNNNALIISAPLSLAADTTIGGTGTAPVSLSGIVSGPGMLIKTTANNMVSLNGANTYSGGTLITGGILQCGLLNPSPLGTSVNVTIQTGGTLHLDRNQITGSLTLNGGTLSVGNGWADDSWTGPVALAVTSTINVGSTDGAIAVDGVVSGTGGLIKLGTSPRPLKLLGDNTFTGPMTIIAGVVSIEGSGRLESGSYAATIANNGIFNYGSTADQTLTGVISGSGSLSKSASSTLTLTAVNTFTGATTVSSGALVIGGSGQLNSGAYAAGIALGNSTAALHYNSTAAQTLSGSISGAGSLTQAGPGTLTLATNTYSGDTTVSGGVLVVNGASLSDLGKLTLTGGKVQATGTETVDTLFFGATQKAAGTWGATGSGAAHIDDVHFAGTTGMVNVTTAPIGGSDYDTWAATYPGLTDTDPTHDPDGDGMTTQQEYAFALDPTLGSSVNPITSKLSTGGVFAYTRRNPDLTALVYTVWTTTDLRTWTEDTGATQAADSPTADVQSVTVTLTAGPSNGKLFVRVQAAPAP